MKAERKRGSRGMESRSRRNLELVTKWLCYSLVLVLAAVLQTTPRFLNIGSVKPVFLLPVCLAVALCEGPYAGALFGAVGGLLWDLTAGRTVGLLGISAMLLCFGAALIVVSYLKVNHMNFVFISGAGCLFIVSMDFLFNYVMRGYSDMAQRFWGVLVPICVFTAAISPPVFWLVQRISQHFAPPE